MVEPDEEEERQEDTNTELAPTLIGDVRRDYILLFACACAFCI